MRSGYGQGRMKNQPSTIGVAVPTARVSRKLEIFPGKKMCAIVEKRKAENAKPEMTNPKTVVIYTQEQGECGRRVMEPGLELTILSGKLLTTALRAAE